MQNTFCSNDLQLTLAKFLAKYELLILLHHITLTQNRMEGQKMEDSRTDRYSNSFYISQTLKFVCFNYTSGLFLSGYSEVKKISKTEHIFTV